MTARVERGSITVLPSQWGRFVLVGYRDVVLGVEHAVVFNPHTAAQLGLLPAPATGLPGDATAIPDRASVQESECIRVRVHSECLTGDILGSLRCDCGPQLQTALQSVAERGGVVVYVRGHEGRGVGLLNKIAAYRLQDQGCDTVDAQSELGLPVDAREYGAVAAILSDVGVQRVCLLTNNPAKVQALHDLGVEVASSERLVVEHNPANRAYLTTKRDRMGHHLPKEWQAPE